jgi:sugar phosphate isomerase/epimerase
MIRALGHKRLKALHIHDNDLIHDSHTLPFTQKIHWEDVMTALKEIQYDGVFTFEADNFLKQFPRELIVPASRLMLEVGRYLRKLYLY